MKTKRGIFGFDSCEYDLLLVTDGGWVINGAWQGKLNETKTQFSVAHTRAFKPLLFDVPEDWYGNYNEILNRYVYENQNNIE